MTTGYIKLDNYIIEATIYDHIQQTDNIYYINAEYSTSHYKINKISGR